MSDKKNVISFSLYGREPLYCEGAKINARLARDIYPGWTVRFYTDETVPVRVIEELHSTGAEIVGQNPRPYPNYGRYWRFLVANDPRVDRFIIRDADSPFECQGGGCRRRMDQVRKIFSRHAGFRTS